MFTEARLEQKPGAPPVLILGGEIQGGFLDFSRLSRVNYLEVRDAVIIDTKILWPCAKELPLRFRRCHFHITQNIETMETKETLQNAAFYDCDFSTSTLINPCLFSCYFENCKLSKVRIHGYRGGRVKFVNTTFPSSIKV